MGAENLGDDGDIADVFKSGTGSLPSNRAASEAVMGVNACLDTVELARANATKRAETSVEFALCNAVGASLGVRVRQSEEVFASLHIPSADSLAGGFRIGTLIKVPAG